MLAPGVLGRRTIPTELAEHIASVVRGLFLPLLLLAPQLRLWSSPSGAGGRGGCRAVREEGRILTVLCGESVASPQRPPKLPPPASRAGTAALCGAEISHYSCELTGAHGLAGESLRTGGEGADSGQDNDLCSVLWGAAYLWGCFLGCVRGYGLGESSNRAPALPSAHNLARLAF